MSGVGTKITLDDLLLKQGGTFKSGTSFKFVNGMLVKAQDTSNSLGGEVLIEGCSNTPSYYAKLRLVGSNFRIDSSNGQKMLWNGGSTITFSGGHNDYAETWDIHNVLPGQCITKKNNKLEITTERLQKNCAIISDTYGICIGTEEQTPVALTGRVLAYIFQSYDKYKLGDCVCSAPNGTVDVMTREEIQNYPDAIIGTVDEIPSYTEYKRSNDTKISTDNRIWIRLR